MNDDASFKAVGGVAPYGYRWGDGRLVVDPAEARVRLLIFELFIKHRRKKTVAKILNELGHRTRRGSVFYDTTVLRLLTDKTAKGVWEVDGREIPVEAIVPAELWERANAILGGAKPSKRPAHLFMGLAHCDCGARMEVPNGSTKYTCPDCRRKIPCDDLEEIFVSQLQKGMPEEGVAENWDRIGPKDKRVIVEHLCEQIVLGANSIHFELSYSPPGSRLGADLGGDRTEPDPATTRAGLSEPLLSENEAARFLGVSKMTIGRKRRNGELQCFRVGARVLYSKEDHLLPYLERTRTSEGAQD